MQNSRIFQWRAVSRALALAPFITIGGVSAQPSPPRARLVEDLRLDAKKEDFPAIAAIAVGPRNQIVIPIDGDRQIRVYDANGKRIGSVGRRGKGPGEFEYIGPLMWKADTLVVDDYSQRRFTYISPDVKVLRTAVYPTMKSVQLGARKFDGAPGTGVGPRTAPHRPFAMLPDGSQLAYWNEPVKNPTPLQIALGGPLYIVHVTLDGTARTIFNASDYTDDRIAMEAFGFGEFAPFTFVPKTVASATGDRLAHLASIATSSEGGTFTVSLFRSNGDVAFVRTFPFRGVPIPKAARDSEIADYANGGEGGKAVSDRFQEQARQKMPLAYAGVDDVLAGLDNTVWISLRATAEGRPVLVLNAKGDPIATVLVPKNSRLRQASATHVWMTEKDSDGLVSVVRYKVSGISCGSTGC
ncbi:MAG: hypothetical protein ABJB74_10030 [Gemmatimonas sp.]